MRHIVNARNKRIFPYIYFVEKPRFKPQTYFKCINKILSSHMVVRGSLYYVIFNPNISDSISIASMSN